MAGLDPGNHFRVDARELGRDRRGQERPLLYIIYLVLQPALVSSWSEVAAFDVLHVPLLHV